MQKEILELHNLIKYKNIDKAYVEAKKIYQKNNKNVDIIKILSFIYIQKDNLAPQLMFWRAIITRTLKKKILTIL